MKKILLILTLLNCFCCFGLSRNKNKVLDSTVCLEINGRIINLNKLSKNAYKVELISNNRIIDSATVIGKSEFKFILSKNCHYAIRISRPGYVSRLISVYTNIPVHLKAIYRFEFDTELIEETVSKNLDSDALDFPIAVISFHPDFNNFYYSEEYTSNIKRQLYLRKAF